ncbi:MAG: ABC transporter transmembrane domain-containing protein [Spirochaetota bacterium]
MSKQQTPNQQSLKMLLDIASFLSPYKAAITGAAIALLFTSGMTLSLGQGFRILVDKGFAIGSQKELTQSIAIILVIVFFLALGTFVRFYLVSWIGERVTADIRKAVFNHVIGLHPGYFETNLSSEIQSRVTTDTTLLQSVIGSSVSLALRNTLMMLGGVIWLFITNPKLTGIVMISVPLVFAPILILGRRVRRLSRDSQDEIAHVGSYIGESLQNVKTVQSYNHQDIDRQNFAEHVEAAFAVSVQRIRHRSWLIALVMVLIFSAIALMIWVGGNDVIAGRITGGELMAFVFYSFIVGSSVVAVSQVIGELQRAAGATERLMELLHAENLILAPVHAEHLPQTVRGKLSIEKLQFSYPSRPESAAIANLDLDIAAGSNVALVGPSGAGKTTLFDLLMRFYDPQAGMISLDGVGIKSLPPEELRQHIAIVPQQPALFSDNVRENIRYGRPDATDAEVERAAEAAFATEFIDNLSEKYGTYLGESGVRLSGGQRQRIAIARAILKDPKILLLDEATSALDAQSEYMVQQALEKLMQNRTTLIIAHRLATVVNVDRIVVLENGELVASGKHKELLASSPLYARLAELQFDQGLTTK